MRVAVSGSSGLIGQALLARFSDRTDEAVRLVRNRPAADGAGLEIAWDPRSGSIDAHSLAVVDAVVNLSGVAIGDRRWSPKRKRAILESRVVPTRLLCETIAGLSPRPRVLVNASAIGFYGDRGEERLTEQSGAGTGFTAEVCSAWEAATRPAERAGIRVVHLRSAVVLAERGGSLARQLTLFRRGLGGKLGTGRQWFSWITLRDEVSVILHLLQDESIEGPVNAAAPNPVRNSDFTKALGRVLGRPTAVRIPRAMLRMALGSGVAQELAVVSQRVVPARLESAGFRFEDPLIEQALTSLLNKSRY
jgi:uncharacterized protein